MSTRAWQARWGMYLLKLMLFLICLIVIPCVAVKIRGLRWWPPQGLHVLPEIKRSIFFSEKKDNFAEVFASWVGGWHEIMFLWSICVVGRGRREVFVLFRFVRVMDNTLESRGSISSFLSKTNSGGNKTTSLIFTQNTFFSKSLIFAQNTFFSKCYYSNGTTMAFEWRISTFSMFFLPTFDQEILSDKKIWLCTSYFPPRWA